MLDVRVCSSCLSKRADGFSRVSEKIWQSCVDYLQDQNRGILVEQDGVIQAFADRTAEHLLLSNEDGFNVEDALLQEVIRAGFSSYRIATLTN
ncbi:hypothetical protein [Amphritea sp. HPY]|uniref:hypothetical protein n=1 Tax=Amphritea sp. HPY TaxID=3421652 RepID=UPI003D7CA2FE